MIKVKIPQLLAENNMSASDLMREAKLAYRTALRLAKGEGTSISFEVLSSLCVLFDVGVEGILEFVPDEDEKV